MPLGPTTTDANGIKHVGESEVGTGLFSDILGLISLTVSAAITAIKTRLDTAEAKLLVVRSVRIIPTATNTGGTLNAVASDGEVTATGALTMLRITLPAGAPTYKRVILHLRYLGASAGSQTLQLCAGATPNATTNSYLQVQAYDAGTARTVTSPTSTAGWAHAAGTTRKKRRATWTFYDLQAALETSYKEVGFDSDGAGASLMQVESSGEHTQTVAYDGVQINLSGMGSLTSLSAWLEGVL